MTNGDSDSEKAFEPRSSRTTGDTPERATSAATNEHSSAAGDEQLSMCEGSFGTRLGCAYKLVWRRVFWKIALLYGVFFGVWCVIAVVGTVGYLATVDQYLIDEPFDSELWYAIMVGWSILMTTGQTLTTVLHRPMHRAVFSGSEYDDNLDDILSSIFQRLPPVFGVNALLSVVLHASPYVMIPLVGMFLEDKINNPEEMLVIFLVFGIPAVLVIWFLLFLLTLLVLGPAPYLVATRDVGVFGSLWASLKFVFRHFWIVVGFGLLFLNVFALLISAAVLFPPLLLLAPVIPLGALVYWHGVFAALEAGE